MGDNHARRAEVLPRRRFVAAGTATVAALFVPAESNAHACDASAISPADSLVLYIDLLRDVQTELLQRAAEEWNRAAEALDTLLKQLVLDIQRLAFLAKQGESSPVHALAEDGSRLLRNVGDPVDRIRATATYARAVGSFAEQADRTGLPLTLSADAATLLRKVADGAIELDRLRIEADLPRKRYSAVFATSSKTLDRVRDQMLAASGAIQSARAGLSSTVESVVRARIDDAISRVEEAYQTANATMQAGAHLIALLKATSVWVSKEPQAARLPLRLPLSLIAGVGGQQPPARDELWALIDKHCPVATLVRVVIFLGLLMPIWVAYDRVDQRRDLIRTLLRFAPCHRLATSMDAFVADLASFRISP